MDEQYGTHPRNCIDIYSAYGRIFPALQLTRIEHRKTGMETPSKGFHPSDLPVRVVNGIAVNRYQCVYNSQIMTLYRRIKKLNDRRILHGRIDLNAAEYVLPLVNRRTLNSTPVPVGYFRLGIRARLLRAEEGNTEANKHRTIITFIEVK